MKRVHGLGGERIMNEARWENERFPEVQDRTNFVGKICHPWVLGRTYFTELVKITRMYRLIH